MAATVDTPFDWRDIRGDGVRLKAGGRSYIDCASGTFNLSLGYSATEVKQALHEQIERCCHLSSELTREKSLRVFESLREHLPSHIDGYWFRDIVGSTAIECAVRIAQKATGKTEIISLFGSHHGQSIAATGISGNAFRQASFRLPVIASLKVPAPDCNNCFYDKTPDSCGMFCATRLDDFLEYASSGQVAAVVIEPILGNGGNIVPPPDYFGRLREFCDRHGILVIADEVQTGFGRTGEFFASNGLARELRPDVIVFAKGAGGIGIPVAGVLMRRELDVLEPWEHSSTAGANPLALVALQATIDYINKYDVLANVRALGPVLRTELDRLGHEFPSMENVRGEGLMLGFDLPDSASVAAFIEVAKGHGLLLRGSRYGFGRTVKVRPPLVVNAAEVADIVRGLRSALTELQEAGVG
ncbi:aspartate aminotransferase family protein [Krasilnikovia sp. M28-CT-15]|uniref:aspartate aminotransferase family protein n=1 Tax=Krasilnikovia sp. M28-CT-15 TaxID=3373540 RepID=UPI00387616D9